MTSWLNIFDLPMEIIHTIQEYYYFRNNYPFWYKPNISHSVQKDDIHHEIMIWKESFPKMTPRSLKKYPGMVMGGYKLYSDMFISPPLYLQIKTLQPELYISYRNMGKDRIYMHDSLIHNQ